MRFSLEIGEVEKNRVEFDFNQLLGRLQITVNYEPVLSFVRLFNEPVFEVFDLRVGQHEPATVRIEKRRKALFGNQSRLYVDNRLVRVVSGM